MSRAGVLVSIEVGELLIGSESALGDGLGLESVWSSRFMNLVIVIIIIKFARSRRRCRVATVSSWLWAGAAVSL
jgi:hypothetical protein